MPGKHGIPIYINPSTVSYKLDRVVVLSPELLFKWSNQCLKCAADKQLLQAICIKHDPSMCHVETLGVMFYVIKGKVITIDSFTSLKHAWLLLWHE